MIPFSTLWFQSLKRGKGGEHDPKCLDAQVYLYTVHRKGRKRKGRDMIVGTRDGEERIQWTKKTRRNKEKGKPQKLFANHDRFVAVILPIRRCFISPVIVVCGNRTLLFSFGAHSRMWLVSIIGFPGRIWYPYLLCLSFVKAA